MKTETKSYVDLFFNYEDADAYIYQILTKFYDELQDDWFIKELEIKLMDSGAYRAGIIFEGKQGILDVEV